MLGGSIQIASAMHKATYGMLSAVLPEATGRLDAFADKVADDLFGRVLKHSGLTDLDSTMLLMSEDLTITPQSDSLLARYRLLALDPALRPDVSAEIQQGMVRSRVWKQQTKPDNEFTNLDVAWHTFPKEVFREGFLKYDRAKYDFGTVVLEEVFGADAPVLDKDGNTGCLKVEEPQSQSNTGPKFAFSATALSVLPFTFESTWRSPSSKERISGSNASAWRSRLLCNHDRVRNSMKLAELYEKFVKEVIGPHMITEVWREKVIRDSSSVRCHDSCRCHDRPCAALERDSPCIKVAHNQTLHLNSSAPEQGQNIIDQQSITVLYQYPPTVRAFCSKQNATNQLGHMHNDAEYGHQPGETNFWMPLTECNLENTMWVESSFGKGDWRPVLVGEKWTQRTENNRALSSPTEAFRFHGTLCRHLTRRNGSCRTRVSLDFRCTLKDAGVFDPKWKSARHVHERREMRFWVTVNRRERKIVGVEAAEAQPNEGISRQEGSTSTEIKGEPDRRVGENHNASGMQGQGQGQEASEELIDHILGQVFTNWLQRNDYDMAAIKTWWGKLPSGIQKGVIQRLP